METFPDFDTLVWAKLEGWRPWPALVLDPETVQKIDAAVRKDLAVDGVHTAEDTSLVRFLGTGDHARLPLSKLMPLQDDSTFKVLSTGGKRGGGFETAVTEATTWLERHGKRKPSAGKTTAAAMPKSTARPVNRAGGGEVTSGSAGAAAGASKRPQQQLRVKHEDDGKALHDSPDKPITRGLPSARHRAAGAPATTTVSGSGASRDSGLCGAAPAELGSGGGPVLSASTQALQAAASEAAAHFAAAQRAAAAAHRRAEAARQEAARCDAEDAEAAQTVAVAAERARSARQAADSAQQADWAAYETHLRSVAVKAAMAAKAAADATGAAAPDVAPAAMPPPLHAVEHAPATHKEETRAERAEFDLNGGGGGDTATVTQQCWLPLKKRRL